MTNKNLDKLAGEVALQICDPAVVDAVVDIGTLENLATKALGVLQEQGVYAMMVFLLSRGGNKPFTDPKISNKNKAAICCIDSLNDSLKKDPLRLLPLNPNGVISLKSGNNNGVKKAILEMYLKISESLESLLMVKEFYEQTLIYVRHISKGLQ